MRMRPLNVCDEKAVFGIPLTCFFLRTVGNELTSLLAHVIKVFERRYYNREAEKIEMKCAVIVSLLAVLMLILGGAMFYANQSIQREHAKDLIHKETNYLDWFYFSFVTITTIGFGDFIPGKHQSEEAANMLIELVFLIYYIFGLSIMSGVIVSISGVIEEKTKKLDVTDPMETLKNLRLENLNSKAMRKLGYKMNEVPLSTTNIRQRSNLDMRSTIGVRVPGDQAPPRPINLHGEKPVSDLPLNFPLTDSHTDGIPQVEVLTPGSGDRHEIVHVTLSSSIHPSPNKQLGNRLSSDSGIGEGCTLHSTNSFLTADNVNYSHPSFYGVSEFERGVDEIVDIKTTVDKSRCDVEDNNAPTLRNNESKQNFYTSTVNNQDKTDNNNPTEFQQNSEMTDSNNNNIVEYLRVDSMRIIRSRSMTDVEKVGNSFVFISRPGECDDDSTTKENPTLTTQECPILKKKPKFPTSCFYSPTNKEECVNCQTSKDYDNVSKREYICHTNFNQLNSKSNENNFSGQCFSDNQRDLSRLKRSKNIKHFEMEEYVGQNGNEVHVRFTQSSPEPNRRTPAEFPDNLPGEGTLSKSLTRKDTNSYTKSNSEPKISKTKGKNKGETESVGHSNLAYVPSSTQNSRRKLLTRSTSFNQSLDDFDVKDC